MRTVGVEEELLLVDAGTGEVRSWADAVLHNETDDRLTTELQQEQLETVTRATTDLAALHSEIVGLRQCAAEAAAGFWCRCAALGTSPLPVRSQITPRPRYLKMAERFALTAAEQLTCGCHVHVAVADDDEGVALLDRIRVWLLVLLALNANSPYRQGSDTGYASFRSQAQGRWPSAGPPPGFGSARTYHSLISALIASGTVMDPGMIYFDAGLSANYPTVELRAADVCRRPEDATPIAALDGALIHPTTGRPAGATQVVDDMLGNIRAALSDSGDQSLVEAMSAALFERGNGAQEQRGTFARTNDLSAVVLAAVADGVGSNSPLGSVLGTHRVKGR